MSGTIVRQVKKNEVFTINLEEPSASGYQWRIQPLEGVEVVTTGTKILDEEPIPGSPVVKTFVLRAQRIGEYQLMFQLVRPWEKQNPVRTHQVNIDVSEDR